MYGAVPLRISRSEFDGRKWWDSTVTPTSLEADIATLLPSLESWSKDLHRWGQDDGNRVEVTWQSGSVVSIMVRVDMRRYSPVFLIGFLNIARRHGWVLRTVEGIVLRPSLTVLAESIRQSDAFRFVDDPQAFLTALADAARGETNNPL
jgi:hypothetical protein